MGIVGNAKAVIVSVTTTFSCLLLACPLLHAPFALDSKESNAQAGNSSIIFLYLYGFYLKVKLVLLFLNAKYVYYDSHCFGQ